MHRFASVCPSVTGPKFRLYNNSYFLKFNMAHAQTIASHLPVTVIKVCGTGRWAHFNIKLHFLAILPELAIKLNSSGRIIEKGNSTTDKF